MAAGWGLHLAQCSNLGKVITNIMTLLDRQIELNGTGCEEANHSSPTGGFVSGIGRKMKYKIEKGIQIPGRGQRMRYPEIVETVAVMQVGDSFVVGSYLERVAAAQEMRRRFGQGAAKCLRMGKQDQFRIWRAR